MPVVTMLDFKYLPILKPVAWQASMCITKNFMAICQTTAEIYDSVAI